MDKNECLDCYKIKCRGCGWEPTADELIMVQAGELKRCPDCSWNPSTDLV